MARRRRRGDGSAPRERPDGRWEARVSLGTRNGQRVQRSVYGRTTAECQANRDELLRQLRAGLEPTDPRLTLDGYLARWLEDVRHNVAPSTFVSYSGHVRMHISPLLGGIPVVRLRHGDVRRLIADRLAAGKSPATVVLIVTTLRMALAQGVADRVLPDNVAVGVRLPRVNRPPVRAMSEADTRRLLATFRGDQFEALYILMLGAGLRLGEALGLNWGDVDLERRFARVMAGKSRKAVRAAPFPLFVAVALKAHRAAQERTEAADPVFLGPRNGKRLGGSTVSHALPRLLVRASQRRMTPHGLRHGTATRMAMAGVPMRMIAEQLGHTNPSLTAKVYAHVVPEALRAAIDSTDVAVEGHNEGQTA